jgi:hypothetical protein
MTVKDNGYGGVTNDTMKVDLYKIDYSKKETAQTKCSSLAPESKAYQSCLEGVNPDNIAVELVNSYEFTGGTASSPALNNPRMFVRDANRKQLLLPVFISTYDQKTYKSTTNFVGLKGLNIQPTTAIKESISQHFTSLSGAQSRNFDTARVGYLGDINYFLLQDFAAFVKGAVKVEL